MKTSELIQKLASEIARNGDLPVKVCVDEALYYMPIDEVVHIPSPSSGEPLTQLICVKGIVLKSAHP